MSPSNDRDDETAAARPVTLELYLDGTPANDVAPPCLRAPPRLRLGTGALGLARAYWILWSGTLLNRLGGTVFFMLGIYLTRDRQMSPELAGLVISLYAAGGLLAGPIGGALADRAGRRATLLAGTTLAGTLMLALGLARSTVAIVAIAPCLGFFTDLCRPPLQAAVADVVPPADRARAYGLLHWAINLGFAGAASFGGALADHHFTLLFVIDAGTTLAYGAFVFLGLPETGPAVAETSAGTGARASVRSGFTAAFGDWRFVRFTLIQLLLLLAFAQVVMTLPLDMHAHGLSTARIGWLLGLNGALIVILQPIALRALRGFGLPRWLAVGAALVGVGLGATAFAGSAPTPVYALAIVVWTLGEIGFATAAPTFVAELAPIDRRGTYQGTYQLAWGTACTAAPALGSLVLVHLGPGALWLGCLGLCLVAAALHLRFTGRER